MQEKGIVVQVKKECILVEIFPDAVCNTCGCCAGKTKKVITAQKVVGINKGDTVEIETKSSDMLKAVFMIFVIPVIGLFAGLLIVGKLVERPAEYVYFFGAGGGLVLSFVLIKTVALKLVKMPQVVSIQG